MDLVKHMDDAAYQKYLEKKAESYESLCKRCGECCGAGNDPCASLVAEKDGTYSCSTYGDRLGMQKTVSGKIFTCVPIKDNMLKGFSGPNCAYVS